MVCLLEIIKGGNDSGERPHVFDLHSQTNAPFSAPLEALAPQIHGCTLSGQQHPQVGYLTKEEKWWTPQSAAQGEVTQASTCNSKKRM